MYKELAKRLREDAIRADSGNEINESLYRDILQAADAIEKLQANNIALNGIVSNLVQQIAELRKPRWIPVTECLPKEEVEVLISDNSFFGGPLVAVAYWKRGKCEWRDDMSTASAPTPTHWMPLPEPPKEDA